MTNLNEVYKCNVCGNMTEVVHTGVGQLVCCGQPMELLGEKREDLGISVEKHVPVIEKMENGIKVKVGSVPHPMEDSHFIEWIEILTSDGKVGRKYLKPGDLPEADFFTPSEVVKARIYCNLHGLWKS